MAYYLPKMGGVTGRKRVFQAARVEDALTRQLQGEWSRFACVRTNAFTYKYNNIICQQVNPQVPLQEK